MVVELRLRAELALDFALGVFLCPSFKSSLEGGIAAEDTVGKLADADIRAEHNASERRDVVRVTTTRQFIIDFCQVQVV